MIKIRLFHSFWAEPIARWGDTPDHPQAEYPFYEFDDILNVTETNSLWSSTSFVTVNSGLSSIHFVVLFQVFKCLINASSQTAASISKTLYLNVASISWFNTTLVNFFRLNSLSFSRIVKR